MQFTHLFIKRPVLSIVINTLIMICGFLSFQHITFREYPNIEIPILSVEAFYPNASAEIMETTVTNPIEDALSKIEGLEAMASSTKYESSTINLQLKEGSSIDRALLMVRDALNIAKHDLPKGMDEPIVRRNAEQNSGPPFMAMVLKSPLRTQGELFHIAKSSIRNSFRSLEGVSEAQVWGNPYTMKVRFNAHKMYTLGVTIQDITQAFSQKYIAFPAGKFRDEVPVVLDESVSTPEEFENMVIKKTGDTPILLGHIATVTLIEDTRTFRMRRGDEPCLILSISAASDANALDVSNAVKKEIEFIKQELPDDLTLELVLDQAEFIRASLGNVQQSIIEAMGLVMIIIFVFLRNIRASLIPITTIPIALLGVITVLYGFGYTLNTTTLLALVLSVGLVVDDAIVVLENIYRHIEEGMTPLQAAKKGSAEIGFAILAMTITLASVFTPIAFMQGFTGKLLIEFAVTLSSTVLISGFTALTLSPMMCSKVLSRKDKQYFPKIDKILDATHKKYDAVLQFLIPHTKYLVILAGLLLGSNVWLGMQLPDEMTPKEDRGYVWVFSPAIPGGTLDDQDHVMRKIDDSLKNLSEVEERITFMGLWGGTIVLKLTPLHTRSKSADDVANELRGVFSSFPDYDVYPASWENGLPGMSIVDVHGQFGVAIKTIGSYTDLEKTMRGFTGQMMQSPLYESVFSSLRLNYPSYKIELKPYVMEQLNIDADLVSKTIQLFFSGIRSYDFDMEAQRYEITLETDHKPWQLGEIYVSIPEKNSPHTNLISLDNVASMKPISVSKDLTHYNQMRSTTFNMTMNAGESMARGMKVFEQMKAAHLPKNLRTEWLGAAKVFAESSNEVFVLLLLGLVFIYAVLAIQFESFIDPFIILLTVPLAAFGALLFLYLFGQSLNIFTKVGLLTLIGLITKHGILLVEFANQAYEKGTALKEAAFQAAQLRLRPILMTTCAMVIGSLPLMFSTGAGSESRRAVGITLVGGLSIGTILTLVFIPFAYMTCKRLMQRK